MYKKYLTSIFVFFIAFTTFNFTILSEDNQPSSYNQKIAFVSTRNGQADIFVINENGSGLIKLTTAVKKEEYRLPLWVPNGTKLTFIKVISTGFLKANYELWIANPDGTGISKITENLDSTFPVLCSPDSSKILFVTKVKKDQALKIFNIHDNTLIDVTPNDIDEIESDYSWSPDSQRFVGVFKVKGKTDIYLINLDNNLSFTKLTEKSGKYYHPVWSPDGTKIAFAFDKSYFAVFANSGLYQMNSDGSNSVLLDECNSVDDIKWAPDSSAITYTCCTGSTSTKDSKGNVTKTTYYYGLYIYNANNNGKSLRLIETTNTRTPAFWSPDAQKLAFTHGFVVNVLVSGKEDPLKIKIPYAMGTPTWSPDSNKIACMGYPGLFSKKSSIYIATLDGSTILKLTEDTGDYLPVWSQSGK